MVRTIEEAMADLRHDVFRWKAQVALLEAEGQHEIVAKVQEWIEHGERLLSRWDDHEGSPRPKNVAATKE